MTDEGNSATRYVVLMETVPATTGTDGGAEARTEALWALWGEADAANAKAAVAIAAGTEGTALPGRFVAIPKRSWVVRDVQAETVTRVKVT